MRALPRLILAFVVVLQIALVGVAAFVREAEPVACTFSHPQYSGQCVEKVTPEGKQTPVQACRVVLDCLNNARCVKTYCQATTIRGGWTLVSPKEPEKR
ncbi:MAG TPA: hypothetical protein VF147_00195 [Vicinamibacterales bacterium]